MAIIKQQATQDASLQRLVNHKHAEIWMQLDIVSGLWTPVTGGIVSPSTGVISAGPAGYEDLVVADNDIPNRKFVRNALIAGVWKTADCTTSPGGTTTNILIGSLAEHSAVSVWLILREGTIRRTYRYTVLSDDTALVGSLDGTFLETAAFPATVVLGQAIDGDGDRLWLTVTLTEAGPENAVLATYQLHTAPTDGYSFLIHGGDIIPDEEF